MHAAQKLQCGRVTGNKKFTVGGLTFSFRFCPIDDTPHSFFDQRHFALDLPRGIVRTTQWDNRDCFGFCHSGTL